MLWVWGDSSPEAKAASQAALPLPISPLLQQQIKQLPQAGYMRDLPYGYELLGENLLDLSHLPFSHHGVGGLSRAEGGELELRPLPAPPPAQPASEHSGTPPKPHFAAFVLAPAAYDPVLKSIAARFPAMVDVELASTNISFYGPHHVRYERRVRAGAAFNVELFLCPTSGGRSRVFLFNTAANDSPSRPAVSKKQLALLLAGRLGSSCKRLLVGGVPTRRMGAKGTVDDHMISHDIFDGDGIFLHFQGRRMAERALSYRDYFTPTSADALVVRFRRWLSAAPETLPSAAGAVASDADDVGVRASYEGSELPRAMLLDRYNSHTKSCAVCSAELARVRTTATRAKKLSDCTVAVAGGAVAAGLGGAAPMRVAAAITASAVLAAWRIERAQSALAQMEQSFLFVDYVHAERD